ncbi:MAG: hypothetical protein DCF15_02580 [Phormidesmis priestleyi]|uniref:Uncharacterized protein n=1 Tax=Phormidesmis priestleyi TaxID=268141 RepID=A0A2W4XWY7_9CYAN|nr:MAG: hypothetical protein DCF15_02580 [Phormidesmis priestleyi]
MEPILIISNLLLVSLTGTYAWLTNKNVKQLQKEGEYYRNVVERQLRLSAQPHLYWDLRLAEPKTPAYVEKALENRLSSGFDNPSSVAQVNGDVAGNLTGSLAGNLASNLSGNLAGERMGVTATGLALEVFNISNVPAYDVHVSIIGAYTEEGLGIATFLRTYVQTRHRKYPLQPDKVGYYGVRNALRLSLLPTQQKIVLSLPFALRPVDVYTLVQYRELSGENYYQVCCFSAIDESGVYRANILEPAKIQTMERLHLFDLEDFDLPLGVAEGKLDSTESAKEGLPYYLADFIDLWNHSISSRLLLNAPAPPTAESPVKATYDF